MIPLGRLNKLVEVQRVTRTAERRWLYGELGDVCASAGRRLNRRRRGAWRRSRRATITTPVTHLVTMPHVADLTGADRIWYDGRGLYIAGVQNPNEDRRWHVLACEER